MNKLIIIAITLLLVFIFSISIAEESFFEVEDLYSVDILNAKCKPFRWRGEGQSCGNEANYTSACSFTGLTCSSTSNTCIKRAPYGSPCQSDSDCPGLSCLGNKCTRSLGYGEPCTHNDQCNSKWCLGGICAANMTGQYCLQDSDCKFFNIDKLYCFVANKTCNEMGKLGEFCNSNQKCVPELSCVKPIGKSDGTCQQRALPGANCSYSGTNGNPECVDDSTCVDGRCVQHLSGPPGSKCTTGMECGPNLACNKSSSDPFGLCVAEGLVKCDASNQAINCKAFLFGGYCSCNMGPDVEGVCASDPNSFFMKCIDKVKALTDCHKTKCNFGNRGSSLEYGDNHCHAKNCKKEVYALNCCVKDNAPGFFPHPEFSDQECIIPQPSKSPSSAATTLISGVAVVTSFIALLA